MAEGPVLAFTQIMAAMRAMTDKAMETPDQPVAMAVVDAAGNLLAYATMDNLRLFSRRSAIRKAYTAAIIGMDSSVWSKQMSEIGRNVSEMGDPNLTVGPGGLVLMKDGVILGGLGVGGYARGVQDEVLARIGLQAMKL